MVCSFPQGALAQGHLGSVGHSQPSPVTCQGQPAQATKQSAYGCYFCRDLEVPRRCQATKEGHLLLVPGLRPLSKKYWACPDQVLLFSEIFGKSAAQTK